MILDYRKGKNSVLQMVLAPLRLESYSTDGQMDTQISRHLRVARYEYCISERQSTGLTLGQFLRVFPPTLTKTSALFPNCTFLTKYVL